MNKKLLIISGVAIFLGLIIVIAINFFSFGNVVKEKTATVENSTEINKVTLDYSLRLKEYKEYPVTVDEKKELIVNYDFKSPDNAVKVTMKNKEDEQVVHSFFISTEEGIVAGTEKIKLEPGEYIMEVLMPPFSEGKVIIDWK